VREDCNLPKANIFFASTANNRKIPRGIDPEIIMRRKFLLFVVAKKRIMFYI